MGTLQQNQVVDKQKALIQTTWEGISEAGAFVDSERQTLSNSARGSIGRLVTVDPAELHRRADVRAVVQEPLHLRVRGAHAGCGTQCRTSLLGFRQSLIESFLPGLIGTGRHC